MKCPKCQAEVAAGLLSCPSCGAQISEARSRPAPTPGGLPTGGKAADPSLGDFKTRRPDAGGRRFKPGYLILDRYRVTGELGQGGMGVVYKCLDEVGGIEVALKALPPELSHNSVEMEEVRSALPRRR